MPALPIRFLLFVGNSNTGNDDLPEINTRSECVELEIFLCRQDAGATKSVGELASLGSYVDDVLRHGETLAAIIDAADVVAHGEEQKKC